MNFYTIGHSTLDLDEFIHLLRMANITHVADVRSMPGSTRYPWFNAEDLGPALASVCIGYQHYPDLGGRRSPKVVTPELERLVAGWEHPSFRSYAAWTQTAEFAWGLVDLYRSTSDEDSVALLCSEALPWRCHRSILATVLVARGEPVTHIMRGGVTRPHVLGEWGPPPVVSEYGTPLGEKITVTWPGGA